MDRKLSETLPDLSVAADEKVDGLGRTLMWHGGVQIEADGAPPPPSAAAAGRVQIVQSVVISRTRTISEADADRLIATLVPFQPAAPPQPLAARRPALDRTRIDLQQLPSKLRAAEIWAQQAKAGTATRVLDMSPTVPVVIDAHAEVSVSWRERAAAALHRLGAQRPQLSALQRKLLVGLCAIGIGTLAGRAARELRPPQPSAAKAEQPTSHPNNATATTLAAATHATATGEQPTSHPNKAASTTVAAATHAPATVERGVAKTVQPSAADVTQRSAVDALIAGQYQQAADRYRALARAYPGEPAYEAAARILSRSQAVAH
jgi:hypothetical protein